MPFGCRWGLLFFWPVAAWPGKPGVKEGPRAQALCLTHLEACGTSGGCHLRTERQQSSPSARGGKFKYREPS